MKLYNFTLCLVTASLLMCSCSSFFDTVPKDELSPATFWKTEKDALSAVTGCYDQWSSPRSSTDIFFADCMSDIGYNESNSGQYRTVGNGSFSQSRTVSYYDYSTIRKCNTFLIKAQEIPYSSEAFKKDLFAQVRTIRAWRYFQMNFWYGGVPLILDLPNSSNEAKVPRNSEEEIKNFVYAELDEVVADLNPQPSQTGRIAQGTALAIKMRSALYWGDYSRARDAAQEIVKLKLYELDQNFQELFSIKGQGSKEIIYSMQHVANTYKFSNMIRLYNNQDGGWASMVPTQDFIDMFEMESGLLPSEANSGYNPVHPYANRDPRLALTVIYPGMDWVGSDGNERVINTLDKTINGKVNSDYYNAADNSSRTGMIWAKYTVPLAQYSAALNNENTCPILFRYAEVLLTIAEANVELNENLDDVCDLIDQLRIRGGHIAVDRSKYNSQKELRELVRRERCIELAGEGLRRADLVRWKDEKGKMLAETLLNGTLYRITGTVDVTISERDLRAIIDIPTEANKPNRKVEDRVFKPFQRYFPIPQVELDRNPKLKQNEGY